MVAIMIFVMMGWHNGAEITTLLPELRMQYESCSKSEKKCDEMLKKIPNNAKGEVLGYKAALTMMKATWAFLPTTKWAYFNEGKDLLEYAIKQNPNNIELRYIRYSVQLELPSFLLYDHMQTDRAFIKSQLPLLQNEYLKLKINKLLK